jgi:non-ribosomal peptide synthetase component F
MANGKALQVGPATRMLQFASYTFDVSNRDMLITLRHKAGFKVLANDGVRLARLTD